MLTRSDATYTTAEEAAQDKAAWDGALILLIRSGLTDPKARRFFGGLLSKRKMVARALLPAVEAGLACGTHDAVSWLTKASQRAEKRLGDPALKVDWT